MKSPISPLRPLLAGVLVLAATACRTRREAVVEPLDGPETTTGLPYYPPGPVEMIDPPPGFRSYALPAPVSRAAVPARRYGPPPLAEMPVRPVRRPEGTNEWIRSALPWVGTPYRLGGEDRTGVDCSAYAAALHREVGRNELPRTALEQWKATRALGIGAFQPGDLVFFSTLGEHEPTHVGVMVGERRFTHASTSTGVTFASLDDDYWSRRFMGARRVPDR